MDAPTPDAAGSGAALHALDLDRLFHEGDAQTWDVDDWTWNSYDLLAEPREGAAAAQAAKRFKADAPAAAAAGGAAGAAAASTAACCAGHPTPTVDAAAGGVQLGMQLGPYQSLLAADAGVAAVQVPWAHQLQQMQQLQQAQLLALQGSCALQQPPPAPAPLRQCQALAHGLPFLAPGGHLGGALSGALATPAMAAAAAAGNVQLVGLELGGLGGAQQHARAGSGAAAAAPAAGGAGAAAAGADSASVADSGSASDGAAAAAAAAAAVERQASVGVAGSGLAALVLPAGMPGVEPAAAAGGALADTPSTLASGGHMSPGSLAAAAGPSAAAGGTAAESAAAGGGDAAGEGEQKMVCQVPGCGRDLSGLKDYHQRYRICDMHIKLPQVMKDGRLQRFCQQCGRFHDLSAFDGNRKSCREQLQKHNARRRRRAALEANMSMADSLLSAVDDKSEVGKLLQSLLSNPFQLQALRLVLGMQTHPALPAPAAAPAEHAPALAAATAAGGSAGGAAPPAAAAGPGAPGSYEAARAMMEGAGRYAPSFESDGRVLRLAAKLFNITPADLPPDLRSALTAWLGAAPAGVEGYIRPGCVFLCLHISISASAYEAARADGLERLLNHLLAPDSLSHSFWRSHIFMLQLFSDVAVVAHGQLVSLARMAPPDLAAHCLPRDLAVSPLCLVAGEDAELELMGTHIGGTGTQVVIKSRGAHLHLGPSPPRAASPGAGGGCCGGGSPARAQAAAAAGAAASSAATGAGEVVRCRVAVPRSVSGAQVVWVEVASGAYLSEARPLLVVEDEALAEEVNALRRLEGSVLTREQVDCLLLDLGAVLQHIHGASPAAGHGCIAAKARRLIAFAIDQGWAAVAIAVLPLAQACGSCAADIVANINASTATDGLSLLHRAVRSGSPDLVRGILSWGAAHGYRWPISRGGPSGITPLHLSALLDDDGVVALLLLDAASADEGPGAFTHTLTHDGVSPFHLAFQMGHWGLDRVLAALGLSRSLTSVVEQQLQPSGWQLLKEASTSAAAAASDGSGGAGGGGAGGSSAAAAPAAAKPPRPLKERHTSCLDACLYCQSTLPPLLLSIKAKCAGCGVRQPCVQPGGGAAPAAAAPPQQQEQQQRLQAARQQEPQRLSKRFKAAATGAGGRAAATAGSAPAPPPGCAHATGKVLSVTALCQTCHANRVLEVA